MKYNWGFICVVLLILTITSCDKRYKYIETIKEKDLIGNFYNEEEKEPEEIFAKNDSLAYLEAFEKFCISVEVWKRMAAKGMVFEAIPMDFALYNEKGEKIHPYIQPETLSQIEERIMSIEGITEKSISKAEKQNPIDSSEVKRLSPLFNFKKDEFDPRGVTWIKPKSAPAYTNMNGIYCYFMMDDNGVSNFRLKIQYHSDDWLFIRKYQFSIDGKAYEFTPNDVERDNGNGGRIWEWCDESIRYGDDIEMLKALSIAKKAKIKFIGNQYHNIRTITQKEIKSIKNTIDLYIAMGGNL